MVEEVLCPHCDRPTVLDPPASAQLDELHASLRYGSRETCTRCDREFSVRYR